jgi:hypothetical protein
MTVLHVSLPSEGDSRKGLAYTKIFSVEASMRDNTELLGTSL